MNFTGSSDEKTTSRCRLRPLEEADLAIFEHDYSSKELAGEFQWFGFSSPGRGLVEMGRLNQEGGRLTIIGHDERVIGSVFWFRKEWAPPDASWCWELALHIRDADRSKGYGQTALWLVIRYLFDHTRVWRIQALTDADNDPAQRILMKAGFANEGRLRGVQWREGRWHDHLIFAILRSDVSSAPES